MSAFEFKLNVPGEYLLVDHALYRVNKGAAGVLMVQGEHNPDVYDPPAVGTGSVSYTHLTPPTSDLG